MHWGCFKWLTTELSQYVQKKKPTQNLCLAFAVVTELNVNIWLLIWNDSYFEPRVKCEGGNDPAVE